MRLGARAEAAGFRLLALDRVGSTNDAAAEALRAGDGDRLWVTARAQAGGRGRNGRSWESPEGNLYASLGMADPCPPALAPQLGFVAGVALHEAVTAVAGLPAGRLALKWPNDLLLDGAKLAGILVEGHTPRPGTVTAVIGIGVNVAHHPPATPYPATDLATASVATTAADLFAALSDALAGGLARWRGGEGFAAVRREWLARAGGLGQTITVRRPDGDRRGIFADLDEDGRLLLDEGGRRSVVSAGDVFLTPPPPRGGDATSGDSHR